MNKEDLQVEKGHFVRIVNPLLEELVKIPFKGCELAVALYIIRKTYGFNKTQDEIPLSQFQKDLCRSRQTIVTALKNLQLVQVVRLVKRGNMKGDCNIWSINKYYDTWKLVNMARLVQRNDKASLTERLNLVKTARQSKDTKNNTKDIGDDKIVSVIDSFKVVNPSYRKFFGNTTERKSAEELVRIHGLDKVLKVIAILPKSNLMPYIPKITSPWELEQKWAKLEAGLKSKQVELQAKKTLVI